MPLCAIHALRSHLVLSQLSLQLKDFALVVFSFCLHPLQPLLEVRLLLPLGLQRLVLSLHHPLQLLHVCPEGGDLVAHALFFHRLARDEPPVLLQLELQLLPPAPQQSQLLGIMLVLGDHLVQLLLQLNVVRGLLSLCLECCMLLHPQLLHHPFQFSSPASLFLQLTSQKVLLSSDLVQLHSQCHNLISQQASLLHAVLLLLL
mmetsp:Transcript_16489/g.55006  ORF Transcript_16489/g.55006 Transcript_16489/m.55006 type:complete len:203 (-) Transcript_16489:1749-2357(-)